MSFIAEGRKISYCKRIWTDKWIIPLKAYTGLFPLGNKSWKRIKIGIGFTE
ncbi:hypothetical protein FHT21_001745 [Pedobacter sp. SG908]|nr:hypothetical protein [Pedobacter sp. SG908]NMN36718.1 hypothetical protein [Pedobacter sp. SG918]